MKGTTFLGKKILADSFPGGGKRTFSEEGREEKKRSPTDLSSTK